VGGGSERLAASIGTQPLPPPTSIGVNPIGPGVSKMALSYREQLALERIAIELAAEDPRLATTLAAEGWSAKCWPRRVAAMVMFVTGAAMLGFAILVPPSIAGGIFAVSILGYFIMFAAALLWSRRPACDAPPPSDGRGDAIARNSPRAEPGCNAAYSMASRASAAVPVVNVHGWRTRTTEPVEFSKEAVVLTRRTTMPDAIQAIEAVGTVTAGDYQRVVAPLIDQARRTGSRMRLLYQFGPAFTRITAGALWEDTRLGSSYVRLLDGCAVVSDIDWIRTPTRRIAMFMPCPVRVYANAGVDDAVTWLTSLPENARPSTRAVAMAYAGGVGAALASVGELVVSKGIRGLS
jgi:hypothetical protein